ncbi:MAG: AAA family ATPase [Paludibacteraceae bacterium]|nr:AAA family ATPase [Paludibacteraceae bacterium]
MEKREYIKYIVKDNLGYVIYVGITKKELSQLSISTIREEHIIEKIGIKTTARMANVWLEKYLQNYMKVHNQQLPKYNQIAMNKVMSPLSITINNLGIIKDATIDLSKKLVLLCGPNNTGKTYVSYIANALFGYKGGYYYEDFSEEQMNRFYKQNELIFILEKKNIIQLRKQEMAYINENLESIFGLSRDKVRKLFMECDVHFSMGDKLYWEYLKQERIEIEAQTEYFKIKIKKEVGEVKVTVRNIPTQQDISSSRMYIRRYLWGYIHYLIINYPCSNTIMFPVERNSVYTFSKELSINRNILFDEIQSMRNNISPMELIRKRSTRYPLAIRNILEIAEDLSNLQKRESEYADFALEIEQKLLRGKVEIGQEGDVQFTPKGNKKKLPIHLTASVVKTLSSLTFYLRHLAQPNDLIIIDEPELNLHPDGQIRLAKIFGRMLNNGLRLVISTHSDYIIREINNLIMIASENTEVKTIANNYEYNIEKEAIPHQEVNAYLFIKDEIYDTVTVEQLDVDKYGFSVKTIDEVIAKQNKSSEDLYDALRYGK